MKTITDYDIDRLTEKHVAKILKSVAKKYPDYKIVCYTSCSEDEADIRVKSPLNFNGKPYYSYYIATDMVTDELKGNPHNRMDGLNASISVRDVDTVLLQKIINRATNRKKGVWGTIFFEDGVATIFFSIFYTTI